MQVKEINNFICQPNPTKAGFAFLILLEQVDTYASPGFVCIPYANPLKEKIAIKYYKIIGRSEIQLHLSENTPESIILKAKTNKEQYLQNVQNLKEQIQLGNIYEINYCVEFFAEGQEINPIDTFIRLKEITNAPFTALIKLGDDFTICCSPELFLKKEGNQLYSKPIKGTIKRGSTITEDIELKRNLFESIKERTENVMAVDVARNDLSKIAQRGSVNVNQLYNIETFETVHQMVSTVNCKVNEGTTFEEMIDATFPMASMTGAPKISAMNLINELEDFDRHHYSGTFGLIDELGDFELPVVIRSIFYNQKTKALSIAAGGAITYLSEAEKEYEEVLLKIKAQLFALNASIEN